MKLKVGDKVRFIDDKSNRHFWVNNFKSYFAFDDIVVVEEINIFHGWRYVILEGTDRKFVYMKRLKKIKKGQLELPFGG